MDNIVVITKTELVEIIQETLRSAKQDEKMPEQQNEFLDISEASNFLKMAKQTLYGLRNELIDSLRVRNFFNMNMGCLCFYKYVNHM